MKKQPKAPEIHVIVAFSTPYARSQKKWARLDDAVSAIHREKRQTKSRKRLKELEAQDQALREKAKTLRPEHCQAQATGTYNIGYYLSAPDAVAAIKAYPATISENGYYCYLVVEEKPIGLGLISSEAKNEIWFKLQNDNTYKRCRKPARFHGIVDFAS